jgi:hypothetical protein
MVLCSSGILMSVEAVDSASVTSIQLIDRLPTDDCSRVERAF